MIVDPATDTVTHLVIEPRHGRHPGRLVPLDLVDTASGGIKNDRNGTGTHVKPVRGGQGGC
ncbi:MAG: hypothetical protein ACRDPY_47825 [Streptosporangiaceae bacterium]